MFRKVGSHRKGGNIDCTPLLVKKRIGGIMKIESGQMKVKGGMTERKRSNKTRKPIEIKAK